MANITITTKPTLKCFEFDFGDYSTDQSIPVKQWLTPAQIIAPHLDSDGSFRIFIQNTVGEIGLTSGAEPIDGAYIVDSIDGVPVDNNEDLIEAILTLRATTF